MHACPLGKTCKIFPTGGGGNWSGKKSENIKYNFSYFEDGGKDFHKNPKSQKGTQKCVKRPVLTKINSKDLE